MGHRALMILAAAAAAGLVCPVACGSSPPAGTEVIEVLSGAEIHFLPDDPDRFAGEGISVEDNGRVVVRTVDLGARKQGTRIIARVVTRPVPKDEISVHDPWDRAGNVRLSRADMPDVELIKFVTAYGGVTEHEVDVTHLAPLLQGVCTFKGFVDTWMSPGWKMDFSLALVPSDDLSAPDWAHGILYDESATAESLGERGLSIDVEIPDGIGRVEMHYLASGHCTDGTDADEFVSKDNVISVDGVVVYRFKPWRDDCRDFRPINPYTRRWSDGTWSSDYSRSGWCPGDWVRPLTIDLSDHLTPGKHVIGVNVEDVRPEDDSGHFGYWRLSGHLVGWRSED